MAVGEEWWAPQYGRIRGHEGGGGQDHNQEKEFNFNFFNRLLMWDRSQRMVSNWYFRGWGLLKGLKLLLSGHHQGRVCQSNSSQLARKMSANVAISSQKKKHPSLNFPLKWDVTAWFRVTESRSHLLLWWTRGRQGQSTTAPDGQLSHFDSSEAVGLTKESPTKRPAKLTHNPLPNSSGFLQLASIFPGWWSGWITRGPRTWWRTATLWLALVGWLQGLPPPTSRPTSAGRYPPSQDSTAPVCNNRENPATCPMIRSSATLNRSPRADCHNNQICLGPGGVG